MKKYTNIMLTTGIILIMSCLLYVDVQAATSFKKLRPAGVMSTAIKTDVVVTWEAVKGASGYELYEMSDEQGQYRLVKMFHGTKVILKDREPGRVYRYYVRAYKIGSGDNKTYSRKSKKVYTTVPEKGQSTIKNFLKVAIAPIGSTMYVWGGGWNKADTAAGKEAKRAGLSTAWRSFASDKKGDYDYNNYRYQIHKGLDCSGYVGWCIYNIRNTANGKKGYVYSASKQAKKFADMGFGNYRVAADVMDYKPGDIMSSSGHVWIALGQCSDGSVVLLHASPPCVQISGTVTPNGKKNSQACKLAKKYMKKYYGSLYKKYPKINRGVSYLTDFSQMRWDVDSDTAVLSDPDGYMDMSVEEVLKDLFK